MSLRILKKFFYFNFWCWQCSTMWHLFLLKLEDVLSSFFRPTKAIWHGSDVSGKRVEDELCGDWSADSAMKRGRAAFLLPHSHDHKRRSSAVIRKERSHGWNLVWSQRLLGQSTVPCNMPLIVLCTEVLASWLVDLVKGNNVFPAVFEAEGLTVLSAFEKFVKSSERIY